jgi:serine/threonine protein kinase
MLFSHACDHQGVSEVTRKNWHSFLHTDIKPKNFMLSRGKAVLIDFGFAQVSLQNVGGMMGDIPSMLQSRNLMQRFQRHISATCNLAKPTCELSSCDTYMNRQNGRPRTKIARTHNACALCLIPCSWSKVVLYNMIGPKPKA